MQIRNQSDFYNIPIEVRRRAYPLEIDDLVEWAREPIKIISCYQTPSLASTLIMLEQKKLVTYNNYVSTEIVRRGKIEGPADKVEKALLIGSEQLGVFYVDIDNVFKDRVTGEIFIISGKTIWDMRTKFNNRLSHSISTSYDFEYLGQTLEEYWKRRTTGMVKNVESKSIEESENTPNYHLGYTSAFDSPYYESGLDFDQQSQEFWDDIG